MLSVSSSAQLQRAHPVVFVVCCICKLSVQALLHFCHPFLCLGRNVIRAENIGVISCQHHNILYFNNCMKYSNIYSVLIDCTLHDTVQPLRVIFRRNTVKYFCADRKTITVFSVWSNFLLKTYFSSFGNVCFKIRNITLFLFYFKTAGSILYMTLKWAL